MTHTYPLQWPIGWPRTPANERVWGTFKVPYDQTVRELADELEKLGADGGYISTDQQIRINGTPRRDRQPDSQFAALYFIRHGKQLCIPCDKFLSVRDNVRAIMLTLQSLRRMERYGTSQMVDAALTGFAALPATATESNYHEWYDVLQVQESASIEMIRAAYKTLANKYHPDKGGSSEQWDRLQKAYMEATKVKESK